MIDKSQEAKLRRYKSLITYLRSLSKHYPMYKYHIQKYDQQMQGFDSSQGEGEGEKTRKKAMRKLDRMMYGLTTKIQKNIRRVESMMDAKVQNKLFRLRSSIITNIQLLGGFAQFDTINNKIYVSTVKQTKNLLFTYGVEVVDAHVNAIVTNVTGLRQRYHKDREEINKGNGKRKGLPTQFFTLPYQLYILKDFYEDLYERRRKIETRLFIRNEEKESQYSTQVESRNIETIVILYTILSFYDNTRILNEQVVNTIMNAINNGVANVLHSYGVHVDNPYDYVENGTFVSILGNDVLLYLTDFKRNVIKNIPDANPWVNYFRAFHSLLFAISEYENILGNDKDMTLPSHMKRSFTYEIDACISMLSKPHNISNNMISEEDLRNFSHFVKDVISKSKHHSMATSIAQIPFYNLEFLTEMIYIIEHIRIYKVHNRIYEVINKHKILVSLLVLLLKEFHTEDRNRKSIYDLCITLINRVLATDVHNQKLFIKTIISISKDTEPPRSKLLAFKYPFFKDLIAQYNYNIPSFRN